MWDVGDVVGFLSVWIAWLGCWSRVMVVGGWGGGGGGGWFILCGFGAILFGVRGVWFV